MNEKVIALIEIVCILVACVLYIIFKVIPEYREEYGSSDKLIQVSNYKNMVEFTIDNKVNFSLVLNKDDVIYHIMFFDKNATCLYNKNIEGKSIDLGIEEVIKILIENDYLKNKSSIVITRYGEDGYSKLKKSLIASLNKYNISDDILENKSTLKEKNSKLKLTDNESDESILRNMDFYSKEFTRVSISSTEEKTEDIIFSEDSSRKLANNVYKKIEKYVNENNIKILEKNNTQLVIQMIPADDNGVYYPTDSSWYYVNDKKVYGYIELTDNTKKFGFCYNGSIDFVKNEVC